MTAAFPTLIEHHGDLVYGIALRSTRNAADAEDLAQEAFVRAYRALQGYDAARIRELRPRGWLAQITLNLARNHARGSGPLVGDLADAPEPPDDQLPHPDRAFERREEASFWRRLLEGLPPRYRSAVALRHVEGLSYRELADALGKPIGTVKSDVHRGSKLLRRAYDEEIRKQAQAARTRSANGGSRIPVRRLRAMEVPTG